MISSTAMRQYVEAYLWLLAPQIQLRWRTSVAAVQAPLIDVLCKGYGGDWKRVWLLGRV
jgi:hypothetical protein